MPPGTSTTSTPRSSCAPTTWCSRAPGPAPDGDRAEGKDAVRAAWAPIFDNVAAHFTTEDLVATDDRAVTTWSYGWGDGHVRGVDVMRVPRRQGVREVLVREGLARAAQQEPASGTMPTGSVYSSSLGIEVDDDRDDDVPPEVATV